MQGWSRGRRVCTQRRSCPAARRLLSAPRSGRDTRGGGGGGRGRPDLHRQRRRRRGGRGDRRRRLLGAKGPARPSRRRRRPRHNLRAVRARTPAAARPLALDDDGRGPQQQQQPAIQCPSVGRTRIPGHHTSRGRHARRLAPFLVVIVRQQQQQQQQRRRRRLDSSLSWLRRRTC